MKRPPAENEQWRLDRTLLRAAERGVKIYISVYKEVQQALPLQSIHTKHLLEALHKNIVVMRHPNHTVLEGVNITLYWAHHEKLCVIDRTLGFVGGLDLCYGRWDLHHHPIADYHPDEPELEVFKGQDYNNARISDFTNVDKPYETQTIDRRLYPRMGWQDLSFEVHGEVVDYLVRHFVERWEFLRVFKYSSRKKYGALSAKDKFDDKTARAQEKLRRKMHSLKLKGQDYYDKYVDDDDDTHNKHKHQRQQEEEDEEARQVISDDEDDDIRNAGQRKLFDDLSDHENDSSSSSSSDEEGARGKRVAHNVKKDWGTAKIQVCRSISDWSHGFLTEKSIQNAYVELFAKAKHSIYLENQFFIAGTKEHNDDLPFQNLIGDAIVQRILIAARSDEKFKVIIVIPAIPGFAGDLMLPEAEGTRVIMSFQYSSICRGGSSIIERIRKAGYNPDNYIKFFCLRSVDRIKYSGSPKDVKFSKPNDNTAVIPEDVKEPVAMKDSDRLPPSVSSTVLVDGPDLENLDWRGEEDSGVFGFVSEQLYIHSKLMIVDDTTIICGSANINDRSQLGDHDSEIAIVIEDQKDTINATIDGETRRVSRLAASLRRFLIRKHLGLIAPQDPHYTADPISQLNYDYGSQADLLVEDPVSEELWGYIDRVSKSNEKVFEKLFHTVPSNRVKNWEQYRDWTSQVEVYNHVIKSLNDDDWKDTVYNEVSKIQGFIVPFPYDFLREEPEIAAKSISYNEMTAAVYA